MVRVRGAVCTPVGGLEWARQGVGLGAAHPAPGRAQVGVVPEPCLE